MKENDLCRIIISARSVTATNWPSARWNSFWPRRASSGDGNLDYTVGLYDEDYNLAATGSCFGNTLRCLAVDNRHQGEGLLNQVISHLIDYQYRRGILDLFLYTKCNTALFFKDLGFYEIARVEGKVVFMENRKGGFERYLERLLAETEKSGLTGERVGAVVMNANPFTLGHQYLVETAAADCDVLHLFVGQRGRLPSALCGAGTAGKGRNRPFEQCGIPPYGELYDLKRHLPLLFFKGQGHGGHAPTRCLTSQSLRRSQRPWESGFGTWARSPSARSRASTIR